MKRERSLDSEMPVLVGTRRDMVMSGGGERARVVVAKARIHGSSETIS